MTASILVVLCCAALASARLSEPTADVRDCDYSRGEALKLARLYGDVDRDNRLCTAEISLYKHKTLYFYERWLLALHPNSNIMAHCDLDGDGFITQDEFENSYDTCLHTCEDITMFFQYFLERSERSGYVKPPPETVDCSQPE
jgi:hypothetical protein